MKEAVESILNRFPEVTWDRWAGELEFLGIFGWIPRRDGKSDFIQVTIENGKPIGFSTSSAEYSAVFAERLGFSAIHNACKRVEHTFDVRCVHLK